MPWASQTNSNRVQQMQADEKVASINTLSDEADFKQKCQSSKSHTANTAACRKFRTKDDTAQVTKLFSREI